jgi:hypothetical protein
VKPAHLAENGQTVKNPALPDDDFAESDRIAQAELDRRVPTINVVVGSSRGGAVAMHIRAASAKLVLLCPAWKKYGTATTVKPGTVILHAEADEVIPITDSRELLSRSRLPETALIVVGNDHRLVDPESLAALQFAIERAAAKRRDVQYL